jgi:pyruvate formate lyase activating enzyme
VTTLVIPGLNDTDEELRATAAWLAQVNPEIPWHLSAFHPDYQTLNRPRTPNATLERAYAIGKAAGLRYIYLGNVSSPAHEGTFCPACDTPLVRRYGYNTRAYWKTPGVCPTCNTRIPGIWS